MKNCRRRRPFLISTSILLLCALAQSASSLPSPAEDRAAILNIVGQYIDGWYEGQCEKMEAVIHPDLVKRTVMSAADGDRLEPMNALALLQYCRRGEGKKTPRDRRRKDINILDIHAGAASVKLVANDFFDYLHLARFNGEWTIMNVLWWELKK